MIGIVVVVAMNADHKASMIQVVDVLPESLIGAQVVDILPE